MTVISEDILRRIFGESCLNLSITGALVESSLRLAPGQKIRFRLRIEGHPTLELSAGVARVLNKSSTQAYGIQFTGASDDEIRLIQSYL